MNIAVSLDSLVGLYRNQSKYDEAESLYKRALEIRDKLGSEHPDTIVFPDNQTNSVTTSIRIICLTSYKYICLKPSYDLPKHFEAVPSTKWLRSR